MLIQTYVKLLNILYIFEYLWTLSKKTLPIQIFTFDANI